MQFQVPQFIEVEDKVFGPFTFRQFVYIMGGVGAAYLIWRVLPHLIAAPVAMGLLGLSGALAFMQWNGRPFIVALESGFYYFLRSKLYLWNNVRKEPKKKETPLEALDKKDNVYIPKLSDSRLHELAWSLDIKERIAAGINPQAESGVPDTMAPIKTALNAKIR